MGGISQHATFVWHVAVAIAVRVLLVLLGAGEALIWQPEVTTPANTILKTREGLGLLQLGVSPYSGDSCHVPPLWLAVTAPVALHPVLCVVPNIVADLVAAVALHAAAYTLYHKSPVQKGSDRDAPWLSASQLALFYLFNPFTILSCVAGTLTSADNAAVMVAVAGGCLRNGPLTGFGLAVGGYLGLHPLLLLVPLLLMLWQGPEDPLQAVPLGYQQDSSSRDSSGSSSHQAADAVTADHDQQAPEVQAADTGSTSRTTRSGLRSRQTLQKQEVQEQQRTMQHIARQAQHTIAQGAVFERSLIPCAWCLASLVGCSVVLIALSDQVLQQHPSSQCLGSALSALLGCQGSSDAGGLQEALSSCWAGRVYGLTLFLRDLTPNIGLWWYFFTEVFTEFQPFFLFVFHSFSLVLMVPMALRFSSRPLFATWVQLFIICMFRPYACVGDMVPWMVLLPLLQQQLQSLKLKMFLINSFVLLLVLGPAMWHQWIVVDSANANFFYSITLLLGVWCTVFLMQMLRLTVLLDRWLAGKGPPPRLVYADGKEVPGAGTAECAAALQAQAHNQG